MATDPHILELQAARKVPEVEILDPRGAKLFVQGAVPKLVGQEGQFGFTEGPVWVPSKSAWIFSDIPNARQYEYSPGADILTDYRNPSGNSNGNFLSNDGELLTCEHANRLLSSTDFTSGVRTTLAKEYNGVELTSPNDVIQSRKTGHIYFTDPDYGTMPALGHGQPQDQEICHVLMINAKTGKLTSIADDFLRPNGLCFDPTEKLMYIADSGCSTTEGVMDYSLPHHLRVFDITEGGTKLENGRPFVEIREGNGAPDGIRCDAKGNVWVSTGEGINVFAPDGDMIAKVLTPACIANGCFGGPNGDDFMLCASDSVWLLKVNVQGAGDVPHAKPKL